MRWPWPRTEKREAQPFTDAITEAIVSQAGGTVKGDPSAIAALETAAGLYARSFAAAEVQPDTTETRAISASVRARVARDLIRHGESVHLVEVTRGRVALIPVGSWDITGLWSESSWLYRLDVFGPSGNLSRRVPSEAVVHVRYATDPARPWQGISPLGWARTTGALAAGLEARLSEEASAPVAHVVAIPSDGGDGSDSDPLKGLKADIARAKGATVLTETTSGGWGEGKMAAPQSDWQPRRLGANPPPTLPALRSDVFGAVLSACGVPPSLATDADGTSQRESLRRFLTTGLQPLGELVAEELAAKLDLPSVRFDFTGTYAHDLAGRAQAFQKLAAGGMAVDQALAVSGLVVAE